MSPSLLGNPATTLLLASLVTVPPTWAADPPAGVSAPVALKSPGGELEISFQTLAVEGAVAAPRQLVYAVSFRGTPVIEPSNLRLELEGQPPLGADVRIVKATPSSVDERYRLVAGKASEARDHCNVLRLDIEELAAPGRKLVIEARAYDDAVAFRYLIPEQAAIGPLRMTGERTEFRVIKDATVYALELPSFRSMYESEFIKLPMSGLSNQGGVRSTVLVGLPTLVEAPGVCWMAIQEADVHDYPKMYLVNPSPSWMRHWFESTLAPQVENPELRVTGTLPRRSPWRIVQVAEAPGRLIESNVLTSLSQPSRIEDTAWIKPGKAAWNWWNGSIGPDGRAGYDTDNMKKYVDFAARSGLEYLLLDGGWSARDDILRMTGRVDVPELVRYGTTKGIRMWIWLHYRATHRQMAEAFPLYEKWGVAGLKIDFVERDDQEGMSFYERVAELAAKHHLLVDFHGSTTPSGLSRTWPNVLGYEAVLGMEQSKAGMRDNPDHHLMLPFTRMLSGPMDYTPGGFENVTREAFEPRPQGHTMVMGTRAHHLAMYVVYEAPIQMVSDHPGNYEGDPLPETPEARQAKPGFEFVKQVPATWDETRVIAGTPGEFIVMARRKGSDWYLGAMTNWTVRPVEIPLSFLGPGAYQAEIYADAADADRAPKKLALSRRTLTRSGRLTAHLVQGGGYAVRLSAVKP